MPTPSRSSPPSVKSLTLPSTLERRHRGFSVRKYRELPTSDGVAYSCEIVLKGKCVGRAENNSNGGSMFAYFIDRADETLLLELAGILDANGFEPATTVEDIVLMLISSMENKRDSRKNTVLRSEPVAEDLNLRKIFEMKGRCSLAQLQASPPRNTPKITQVWVPGEGWIVIATGEAWD